MKKIFTTVLSLMLVMILFSGCSTKKSPYQETEVDNVTIAISDISPTGAVITIKDTNEKPYTYGDWYKIEKENNGQWFEVKTIIDTYEFEDIGYLPIEGNDEIKLTVDWEWLYGKLPSGKYRLIKEVDKQYISVEFTVSET